MSSRRRSIPAPLPDDRYFVRSQQPLHALMLLLPLIAVYEAGAILYANEATGQRLAARTWVQNFLELFGAVGEYLPGLAVVVVLIVLHAVQRRRWQFRLGLYLAMAAESLALAIPLLLFGLLTGSRHAAVLAASGGGGGSTGWKAWMILSIGAGIYEELVFRMFLIAVIHFITVDVLGMSGRHGLMAAIMGSALLFAFSHFSADNPFAWGAFAFYLIAGFYFAIIYLLRGFGIVAATHAFYDVLVVALKYGLLPAR